MGSPLQNDVILNRLFGFLRVEDLKSCRHVCRKWGIEGERWLLKRTAICIDRPVGEFDEMTKSRTGTCPLTSFTIGNKIQWRSSELCTFLKGQEIMNWLKLREVKFFENGAFLEAIDIDSLIENLTLESLTINGRESCQSSKITISLLSMENIKSISLRNCDITVNSGKRISPVEIVMKNVEFYQDTVHLDNCNLIEFIDFKEARKIEVLQDIESEEDTTDIVLDLKEGIKNLEVLDATDVTLLNLEYLKGTLKQLSLVGVSFLQKLQLKILEMTCTDCKVDLSVVPTDIVKMALTKCEISCTVARPCFPNLKSLSMSLCKRIPSGIPHPVAFFKNSNNLVNLDLSSGYTGYRESTFHLNDLPSSVKRLKVEMGTIFEGSLFYLDTLVIDGGGYENAVRKILRICPKTLVATWRVSDPDSELEKASRILKLFRNIDEVLVKIPKAMNPAERQPIVRATTNCYMFVKDNKDDATKITHWQFMSRDFAKP